MKINEPIVLRKMHFGDIPEASRMAEEASEHDPLQHYLRDTPDAKSGRYMEEWRLSLGLQLGLRVRKGLVWTVGNADSMVDYKPPNQAEDDIDKVVNALMPFFGGVMSQMLSPQQKKRGATFSKAFREALESVGERRKEMFELSGLATRPAMQGRGYGSALVRLVTDIADAEGRATWLGSSNIANTGFYEYLGFRIVESITLGESDPTWNEDPIVINLMIREPRARVSAGRPHS